MKLTRPPPLPGGRGVRGYCVPLAGRVGGVRLLQPAWRYAVAPASHLGAGGSCPHVSGVGPWHLDPQAAG